MYTEAQMETELYPLQVLCKNAYTALKLLCYHVNQNDIIILFRNKEQQQKSHAWVHSSAEVSSQVHFNTSFVHIKNKPLSRQMFVIPIHAYFCWEHKRTPSELFGSQWYKKYILPHTFLYQHACSCFLYDILWFKTATC